MKELNPSQIEQRKFQHNQQLITDHKTVLRSIIIDNMDKELLTPQQLNSILFFIRNNLHINQ